MKILIVAVGQKIPSWAQEACDEYLKRFPSDWHVELKTVKTEPRSSGKTPQVLMTLERGRIEAVIKSHTQYPYIVAFDERGLAQTTIKLASTLQSLDQQGREIVLVIGGPDGLDDGFKQSTQARWRLSDLTLPHAMVRVLVAEQLYRAWSVTTNHPYHRE